MTLDTFIGFDSAWTDNPRAPGAITAVLMQGSEVVSWHAPHLVSFDRALAFVRDVRSPNGVTLVALDQPTVVPNATGMRPVEKAAASLISWLGGGVQPSNTGRAGMFCAASPVWKFLTALEAVQDPETSRTATSGIYLIEVFPALALASLQAEFFGRLAAPRYNPARRKTFVLADWVRVAEAAAEEADGFGCVEMAAWCRCLGTLNHPAKADQDRLDSILCVLIALRWRRRPRETSLLLGDLDSGYMVTPATPAVRLRLLTAASKVRVAVDGSAA